MEFATQAELSNFCVHCVAPAPQSQPREVCVVIRGEKALRRDDAHDRTGGLHREKRLQAQGEKFEGLAGARSYPSRITTKHPVRPGLIIHVVTVSLTISHTWTSHRHRDRRCPHRRPCRLAGHGRDGAPGRPSLFSLSNTKVASLLRRHKIWRQLPSANASAARLVRLQHQHLQHRPMQSIPYNIS